MKKNICGSPHIIRIRMIVNKSNGNKKILRESSLRGNGDTFTYNLCGIQTKESGISPLRK